MPGAPSLPCCSARVGRTNLAGNSRVSHPSPKWAKDPDFLYAALSMAACAAFIKESRRKLAELTKPHRKSGFWGTRSFVAGSVSWSIGAVDHPALADGHPHLA